LTELADASWEKTEQSFDFAFCKALMHNARFLHAPSHFVRFCVQPIRLSDLPVKVRPRARRKLV